MYFKCEYLSNSVSFWNSYAKWYKLWIEHNHFHKQILELLFKIIEPNFRVLDIGGGNGVLSLPLSSVGCDVTIIEPSLNMRNLLFQEIFKREIDFINFDTRRWEDIPTFEYRGYDIVIACNSLHLMDIPFELALTKVFSLEARYVFIVSELKNQNNRIKIQKDYELKLFRVFTADTSFAYHSLKEAYEHMEFYEKRPISCFEKLKIYKNLIYENGHYWHKSSDVFGIYIFHRKF
ncbi:MAG: class I SAM-dependent methyltransferase [Proteobacteria bacterium]|nr:class I SAM-dependent methyltransferase [Pseudomonadota bacterium]